ncbi:bifunctional DNA-formamidopyrimidine glycosylase/DNA-(apurinic or apyrimidinic site) lyase [Actinomadura scrupuli]|uniref:bifunctional DNA-formamidopyrimidine glycosylase/DNA-(apurinic or apyrimidinic site) lyase n=1 Tax=Actinomadura scrupuli TaxID=559629 RepID=UPI003D97EB3E
MPELPEVEVVRRGLESWAAGRTVESAEVLHPRAVRRHPAGPGDFAARLTGRRLLPPRRRGKYLWIPLGDPSPSSPSPSSVITQSIDRRLHDHEGRATAEGEALLAHLGMSGQLLVGEADRPFEKHLRVRVTFTDGGLDLRFVDQRTFGHLMIDELVADVFGGTAHAAGTARDAVNAAPAPAGPVSTAEPTVPRAIAHIAPDPLEEAFDEETFFRSLRRRRTGIKRALLDQSLISGVGNIYADEALWRSRLHWARPTETMTRAEAARLLTAAREVMAAALNVGGTSFDSLYVNVNGESGYFDRSLNAYGRRDEPCERCGTPIRRDVFMNRSSYSCPRCQPRPRRPRL